MSFVIVGAGPNLGLAVARRFGREGLAVGLISRQESRLVELAAQLRLDGITVAGAAADIRDSAALAGAIRRLADELGPVEVLEYSPLPAPEFMKPVLETTVDDVRGPLEFSVLGAVAAAQAVIGPMREAGRGDDPVYHGRRGGEPLSGPRRCRDLFRGRGRLRADASRRVARRRDSRRPHRHRWPDRARGRQRAR